MSLAFFYMGPDLGNSLAVKLFLQTKKVPGTGNYIVIEKEYADDTPTFTKTYHQENPAEWDNSNSATITQIAFDNVAAKEMTDKITITIYNAQGKKLSATYVGSIATLLMNTLNTSSEVYKNRVYVALLNYGAAAQERFGYNLDNLANAELTEEQQTKYATPEQTPAENYSVTGVTPLKVGVDLGNKIVLTAIYQKSKAPTAAYATVSFTGYHGNEVNKQVELVYPVASMFQILVDDMVMADCESEITIKLHDAEGNVLSTIVDSVSAYVGRDETGYAIYPEMLKVSFAAREYFAHK